MNAKVIALANQKGGVSKTTTTANLGIGLANAGKKVLLIDLDPQASLTISLGYPKPEELPCTITDLMIRNINNKPINAQDAILHHKEGVDLIPSSIELSGMEASLVNVMSRETVLRQVLDNIVSRYDFTLIDCMPSLGMLTINALTAADSVMVPVQAQYLPAKGLEQLLQTIAKVHRQINHDLKIDGILLAMVDSRTNYSKEITALLKETYGSKIRIFSTEIPHSVRAAETSAESRMVTPWCTS